MRDIHKLLDLWIENVNEPKLSDELEKLKNGDETALRDAFYQDLAFGTGGLRGVIGAGPSRMNIYTVAKATQGLANYLNDHFDDPSVAIARDSRIMGETFVKVVAGVLAANGILSFLYERIEPTPALSFAVRDKKCSAGICMTASHNPAEYNGYKVYGPDGCQITTHTAKEIQAAINAVDIFSDVKQISFEDACKKNLANYLEEGLLDRYIDAVAAQSLEPFSTGSADTPLSVVYTPLYGTGLECVSRILDRAGFSDVTLVEEQCPPDGNFPTCPYPNPETKEALECGLALAQTTQPDLLLATDPDADRIGVAVAHGDEYPLISGNEVGILLIDYICKIRKARREDLSRCVVITTIVSSAMVDALARTYGFQLRRTLTGFKFIGEQIGMLEAAGTPERFIFAFEESYGYLSGTHVRDKDAVNAALLICQMAQSWKKQGKDLIEALELLYSTYGYYKNAAISQDYPGAAGTDRMNVIMAGLSMNPPEKIAGLAVEKCIDYQTSVPMPITGSAGIEGTPDEKQMLPEASVFEIQLENANKIIIRPSGTEPKIKAYLFASEDTEEKADSLLQRLKASACELLSA